MGEGGSLPPSKPTRQQGFYALLAGGWGGGSLPPSKPTRQQGFCALLMGGRGGGSLPPSKPTRQQGFCALLMGGRGRKDTALILTSTSTVLMFLSCFCITEVVESHLRGLLKLPKASTM